MLSDLHELLSVPPEREIPPGRLEQRKALLLESVEADLQRGARRARRPRLLRCIWLWLMSAGLLVLVVGCLVFSSGRGFAGMPSAPRAAVEATAAVPAVAVLLAASRPRPSGALAAAVGRAADRPAFAVATAAPVG